MRLLHVSDFHGRRDWFKWLTERASEFDVTCFTGDWLDLFGAEPLGAQVAAVSSWLRQFPGNLVWCSGNHDVDSSRSPVSSGRWMEDLPNRHAFSRAGRLQKLGWNFVRQNWNETTPVFQAGDIVLAHAPPSEWQTALSVGGDHGDFSLGEALRHPTAAPWLILSGHVHEPASWKECRATTWSFNPGVNPRGKVPNFIVIDTEKRRASWFQNGHLADTAVLKGQEVWTA